MGKLGKLGKLRKLHGEIGEPNLVLEPNLRTKFSYVRFSFEAILKIGKYFTKLES